MRSWAARLCSIALLLLIAGTAIVLESRSVVAIEPSAEVMAALGTYTATVKDQYGQPTAHAKFVVRDGALHGSTYEIIAQGHTDANGNVVFSLDPELRYCVQIYYRELDSQEFWWYGYILPNTWSSGDNVVYERNNPWLDTVTTPASSVLPGTPQDIVVTVDHGLTDTNFGLRLKVTMWVDDDGQEPYLYQAASEVQTLSDGYQPFHLPFTPDAPGHYQIRIRLDRQWESDDWGVADEGGWNWVLDADAPTPTPTITPTAVPVTCTVEGRAYEDYNHNEIWDAYDRPLVGWEVGLFRTDGDQVDQTLTDVDGRYHFAVSSSGSYRVRLAAIPWGFRYIGPEREIVYEQNRVYRDVDLMVWTWYCNLPLLLGSERP
jgi:hypothetical protein